MKKWFLCVMCSIFMLPSIRAQYYRQDRGFLLGVNAGYTYPVGDMGKILKNGLGANLSAKYLINRVIGIGFEAGYHSFKSKMLLNNENTSQGYNCRMIPALLEATFYVPTWDRTILPYFGVHFGAYIIHVDITQKSTYDQQDVSKKLYLFSPGGGLHAGVLFELSERIYLDLKLRADYAPKIEDEYDIDELSGKGNIGFNKMLNPGVNIGLLYKF